MASQDKKWRHHYVWQHYLKAWVGVDKMLSYRENGKDERKSTRSLAFTPDFYRLNNIPDEQMKVIVRFIDGMEEPFQTLARGWIPLFTEVFAAEQVYVASGIKNSEVEQLLDITKSNLEEDLHGYFEGKAVVPLGALRRCDATPIQDPDAFVEFSMFLAFQYFRTPKLVGAIAAMKDAGVDINAGWPLLRTIFATNVSGGLYRQRTNLRIRFLKAASSEFITGDQPILNLAGTTDLDLYYPLAPNVALRLTPQTGATASETDTLSDAETYALNKLIIDAADRQVYATTTAALVAAHAY